MVFLAPPEARLELALDLHCPEVDVVVAGALDRVLRRRLELVRPLYRQHFEDLVDAEQLAEELDDGDDRIEKWGVDRLRIEQLRPLAGVDPIVVPHPHQVLEWPEVE